MKLNTVSIGLLLQAAAAVHGQNIEIHAELLGPLETNISRSGDQVSARVVSPPALAADMLEGRVTESRSSSRRASLRFTFEILRHGSEAIPISAEVKSITNSRGQVDVDEEGRIVRRSHNVSKTAAGAGVGAAIGGLARGGKGAVIGAAAGALAAIVINEVAADGPSVRFASGSRVRVAARSRGGPALASLTPNAAPAPASPAAPVAAAPPAAPLAPAAAPSPVSAAPAQPAAPSTNQPDLTAVKSDFVPGGKTLFYDDFTDMAGDEPPPHWKVRGGAAALRIGGTVRQLTVVSGGRVRLTPMLKDIPKDFTLETEVKFDNPSDTRSVWFLHDKSWDGPLGPYAALTVFTRSSGNNLQVKVDHYTARVETIADTLVPVDFRQPVKQALWMQNGRLRVYINGERVADVNQVTLPSLAGAELNAEYGENRLGYRMVRFAESAPDFSQMISSSGRYVTHGIFFDTDSDRLKPESAPVIKFVAQALETNPNLKLRIEGHTDSVGNAGHNLDLSKRRAEAVKAVLASQFGISAERLTTEGLGASKPIDSNDTPKGRAQNRRVEFVRI